LTSSQLSPSTRASQHFTEREFFKYYATPTSDGRYRDTLRSLSWHHSHVLGRRRSHAVGPTRRPALPDDH